VLAVGFDGSSNKEIEYYGIIEDIIELILTEIVNLVWFCLIAIGSIQLTSATLREVWTS
jgi:hypothetical protein